MPTYIIHTSLLALCYGTMFRPSKGLLQGVHSQNNKICTSRKIQFIEQRVAHYAAATPTGSFFYYRHSFFLKGGGLGGGTNCLCFWLNF